MAMRRRRSRRRWSDRLRRRLVEHKLSAAQAILGVGAVAIALSLLWPQGSPGRVDHRAEWARSLKDGHQTADAAFTDAVVSSAQAGMTVSAKRQLVGEATASLERYQGRLRRVAATMPVIAMGDLDGPPVARPGKPPLPDLTGDASTTASVVAMLGAGAKALGEVPAPSGETPTPSVEAPAYSQRAQAAPPALGRRQTPTWLRNAVATPLADRRPVIAVVMDDLGLNRRGTALLNQLKAPLTLSFLPYAEALAQQTRAAHAAGHELLLHMPMEPIGNEWPGPNALVSSLEPDELASRLRRHLRSFRGFVGINNHMGSLLTTDRESMAIVMAELRRQDLLFLDSRTTPASIAALEASRMGVPLAERDVFIDNELDRGYVLRQLGLAEVVARRNGHAVALGHPHDVTIAALRQWLPTLEERGFALVPISTVVARRTCADGVNLAASGCQRYVSAESLVVQQ